MAKSRMELAVELHKLADLLSAFAEGISIRPIGESWRATADITEALMKALWQDKVETLYAAEQELLNGTR